MTYQFVSNTDLAQSHTGPWHDGPSYAELKRMHRAITPGAVKVTAQVCIKDRGHTFDSKADLQIALNNYRAATPGDDVTERFALERMLNIARHELKESQFAETLTGYIHDLSSGVLYVRELTINHIQALIWRVETWLSCEINRPGNLGVFKVINPLGTFEVYAKSFGGAVFAAAERMFYREFRKSGTSAQAYRKNLWDTEVYMLLHTFHCVSWKDACKLDDRDIGLNWYESRRVAALFLHFREEIDGQDPRVCRLPVAPATGMTPFDLI